MILTAAAALAGYLALYDNNLGNSQVNIASAAIKRHDSSAFAHDPVFGDSKLWLFNTPAYQSMLELVLVPTDYQDMMLPFRVAAGVQTLLLLCGMYALLFWQTRSWSVSVFTAVLSVRMIETFGGAFWGAGTLACVTPSGLCLALWPLVILAFARYTKPGLETRGLSQWRVILVFFVVGLLGNFHLVTAMNMTLVLLIAYVIRQRVSPRCLPVAIAGGVAATVAALPYIWYYFGLRARMNAGQVSPPAETIFEALRIGDLAVFYPELLKGMLDWRVLAGVLVLGLPAIAVLAKIERYITQNVWLWIGLIVGSVIVAMGLHGLSQKVGDWMGTAPPVIDFVQASNLLMLPLYALLAQAITNLFRLLRGHRAALRWVLFALLGAWMVPSANLRVARWELADLGASLLSEADKPEYVLRHNEKRNRNRELQAIADWATQRPGSMYITDRDEFRVLARRPIVAGNNDPRYLYYLAPWRLEQWLSRHQRQDEILHPPAGTTNPDAVTGFVEGLIDAEPDMNAVSQWYLLLHSSSAPLEPGALQPVESGQWGRFYRLYRIR